MKEMNESEITTEIVNIKKEIKEIEETIDGLDKEAKDCKKLIKQYTEDLEKLKKDLYYKQKELRGLKNATMQRL